MRFEENDKTIDVSSYPETFVYFLTRRGEVVYVGQTKKGMARPLAHKYDKDFDGIYIMPCDVKMLDFVESEYIVKYKPEYNKTVGSENYYSLIKTRNTIRRKCNQQSYTINNLKSDCRDLEIVPVVIDCVAYIKREDVLRIINSYEGITWQYSE